MGVLLCYNNDMTLCCYQMDGLQYYMPIAIEHVVSSGIIIYHWVGRRVIGRR